MDRPESPTPTDEALALEARQGDEQAFGRLLRRHEGRVLRVLRLLGVPAADREDVAQDVFIRVFRQLGRFRPGLSFSGWVYRITVNLAHDQRRRSSRRTRGEAAWGQGGAASSAGPMPLQALESQDSRRRLEAALRGLSERERAVFVLCELEELETRHVARALGISSITVRRHLGRARTRLRRLLLQEERQEKGAAVLNDAGTVGVVHE